MCKIAQFHTSLLDTVLLRMDLVNAVMG